MRGPLYITEKSNVHFKKGPDIGAEILFLLNKGRWFLWIESHQVLTMVS